MPEIETGNSIFKWPHMLKSIKMYAYMKITVLELLQIARWYLAQSFVFN